MPERRADLNSQTFWDVLAGRANPTIKTLVQLSNALDIRPRDLLEEVEADEHAETSTAGEQGE